MKAKRFLSLCSCLLVSAVGVQANDVFVYTTGNYTPVASVKNLRSIVYGTNSVKLNAKDGSSVEVAYADFDYYRFYSTAIPTSIKPASLEEATIEYVDGNIEIATQRKVNRVEIISTAGEILAQLKPSATSLSYNAANLPAGTYLIKVVAGNKTYVKKIIKK